jgi:hypothetical protein
MTREQFESALLKPPTANHGEAVFDFGQIPAAPCTSFTHCMAVSWETREQMIEECWQAYLSEFETEFVD